MIEHIRAAHREEQGAHFKFRVLRKCKTSLERQVREAVRISMRGSVLNKKGMYNRCKLTRLVVYTECEERSGRSPGTPTQRTKQIKRS